MVPDEIRRLLNEIEYQLETIDLLVGFGRWRESLPFCVVTLDMILKLDQQFLAGTDCRCLDFPAMRLPGKNSAQALVEKIRSVAATSPTTSMRASDLSGYPQFIVALQKRVFRLRKRLVKRFRSRREKMLRGAAAGAAIILPVTAFCLQMICAQTASNWGLRGEFYAGTDFARKVDELISKQIDFDSAKRFSPKVPNDYFSARWTGRLLVPKSGSYVFSGRRDNGLRIFLDGKCIIDCWDEKSAEYRSAPVRLSKGAHPIKIEFFESYGEERLTLCWAQNGGPDTSVEPQYLRPNLG